MPTEPLRFLHIISPVEASAHESLHLAERITFRALAMAANEAKAASWLEFCHAQDTDPICGLPKLQTLLDQGQGGGEFDYAIYSNIDIAPYPWFYTKLQEMLAKEPQALSIRRRTVEPHKPHDGNEPLEFYYRQEGRLHRGDDCFVFPHEWLPKIYMADTVLGCPPVGQLMFWNLKKLAKPDGIPCERIGERMTFHVGGMRGVKPLQVQDHNSQQVALVKAELARRKGAT